MLANLEATKSRVPMLEISDDVRDDLKRRLAEHERTTENGNGGQQVARLIIGSSNNPWPDLFNGNGWFVMMRLVVPLAYFFVVAASFYVLLQQASLGKFVWGSTSCWVIFIEMVPALALGIMSIFGIFEGTFFAREVQAIFRNGLVLFELLSTILVARYWNAQAKAAKVGYERARAVDPQRSWKSVMFTVAVLGLQVATAFFRHSFVPNKVLFLTTLLLTIVCVVMFIRATLKMLGAARAPDSTRRISAYISASVLCTIIQMAVMIVLSTATPLSPNQFFVSASSGHLTRAGTGLCQLFVFLPCTPVPKPRADVGQIHPLVDAAEAIGNPAPTVSIDTHLLAGERDSVRALQENNDRLEQENARMLRAHQREEKEAKERLQQERTARLQHDNEVAETENKRLKNERAADSSMNHTVKVHAIMHSSMLPFTAVISSDSVY
jgi:hypothetical protein